MFFKLIKNSIKINNFKLKIFKIYKKKFNSKNFKIIYTHRNNTYLIYEKKKNFYRKFSISINGSEKIKNNYNGLKYYCKKRKINYKKILLRYFNSPNLSYVDITNIKGSKIKSWLPLTKTYKYIYKAICHHHKFFRNRSLSIIHGDLTLDNILFNQKEPFIIDWEFFNSKKNYRGYDIAYLVLSSISIPFLATKKFSSKDKYLFLKLWKKMIKLGVKKSILKNPFKFFKNYILKDKILSQSLKISKNKFYPLITPKIFQDEIFNLIKMLKIK